MIKLIKWTAKDDSNFSGEVILKALTYIEKMKALKELNLEANQSGEVQIKMADQIDSAIKMYDFLKNQIESMSLEHKQVGKINDLEELGMLEDGASLIPEMATLLLKGVTLGKL
jgi:hypothetical protein